MKFLHVENLEEVYIYCIKNHPTLLNHFHYLLPKCPRREQRKTTDIYQGHLWCIRYRHAFMYYYLCIFTYVLGVCVILMRSLMKKLCMNIENLENSNLFTSSCWILRIYSFMYTQATYVRRYAFVQEKHN